MNHDRIDIAEVTERNAAMRQRLIERVTLTFEQMPATQAAEVVDQVEAMSLEVLSHYACVGLIVTGDQR